jgi:hypothetical protein
MQVRMTPPLGADEAYPPLAGDSQDLLLQRPPLLRELAEAAALDDRPPDSLSPAGFQQAGHGGGRGQDDGQANPIGKLIHRGQDRPPRQCPTMPSNEIEVAAVVEPYQVFGDDPRQVVRLFGDPDNDDAIGIEYPVHGCSSGL